MPFSQITLLRHGRIWRADMDVNIWKWMSWQSKYEVFTVKSLLMAEGEVGGGDAMKLLLAC